MNSMLFITDIANSNLKLVANRDCFTMAELGIVIMDSLNKNHNTIDLMTIGAKLEQAKS
jgi:hypothetical protein